MLTARRVYPVEQNYSAELDQWDSWLSSIEDEQVRDSIKAKLEESLDWEARFLLMTDKYMTQTDNLGLCNDRLGDIERYSRESSAILEKTQ